MDGNAVVIRIRVGQDVSASALAKKLKEKTGLEFAGVGDSVVSVITIDKTFMDDDFVNSLSSRALAMLNIDLSELANESKKQATTKKRRKRRSRRKHGRKSRKRRSKNKNT